MQESGRYKFGNSFLENELPVCVYCGDPSTDRDHLISCSWEGHRSYVNQDKLVRACKWCNSLLSAVPIFSVPGRAHYLIGRYETKFNKVLKRPYHTEDEIIQTSNNIRILLAHSNEEKRWINQKISNLKRVWNGFDPLPIENVADIVKHGLKFSLPKPKLIAYCPEERRAVTGIPKVRKLTGLRKFRIIELKQSGRPFIDNDGKKWFFLMDAKEQNFDDRKAA
jgi:hypothetical protein